MSSKSSKSILAIFLSLILIFSMIDMIEDFLSGSTNQHLLTELILIALTLGIIIWLLIDFFRHSLNLVKFEQNLSDLATDRNNWKQKAEIFIDGLSKTIEDQFKKWELSKSEIDIGFMLLKGYAQKDIARMRKTSEKTVQTQSQDIYKKTNLKNRSEFSAFFLEDLLPRQDEAEN